jgi:hypothetical protein
VVEAFHARFALGADRRGGAVASGATALRDLEHPARDTARALPHVSAESLQGAREHPDAVRQQRGIRRVVNVGLHDGRVDPQAPALDDPPGPAERDQLRQQVLEDGLVEQVGQADQRLGVGDPLAVDAAERAVDQAPAHFSFALVKAPVVQMLEDQHPQHDGRRGAQTSPALALRMAPGQGFRHPIDKALVVEQRIDPVESWIPELVAVRQEHFDQTALPVRSPHHGASGEVGPPQRPHRVSCAAARSKISRGFLTIAQRARIRQRITVRFDMMTTGPAARTAAGPHPNRTGK